MDVDSGRQALFKRVLWLGPLETPAVAPVAFNLDVLSEDLGLIPALAGRVGAAVQQGSATI